MCTKMVFLSDFELSVMCETANKPEILSPENWHQLTHSLNFVAKTTRATQFVASRREVKKEEKNQFIISNDSHQQHPRFRNNKVHETKINFFHQFSLLTFFLSFCWEIFAIISVLLYKKLRTRRVHHTIVLTFSRTIFWTFHCIHGSFTWVIFFYFMQKPSQFFNNKYFLVDFTCIFWFHKIKTQKK